MPMMPAGTLIHPSASFIPAASMSAEPIRMQDDPELRESPCTVVCRAPDPGVRCIDCNQFIHAGWRALRIYRRDLPRPPMYFCRQHPFVAMLDGPAPIRITQERRRSIHLPDWEDDTWANAVERVTADDAQITIPYGTPREASDCLRQLLRAKRSGVVAHVPIWIRNEGASE